MSICACSQVFLGSRWPVAVCNEYEDEAARVTYFDCMRLLDFCWHREARMLVQYTGIPCLLFSFGNQLDVLCLSLLLGLAPNVTFAWPSCEQLQFQYNISLSRYFPPRSSSGLWWQPDTRWQNLVIAHAHWFKNTAMRVGSSVLYRRQGTQFPAPSRLGPWLRKCK